MAGPGNVVIKIGAETADAIRGFNQVDKSLGDTMTTGQKTMAGLKKAAVPAAAALAAIGYAAVSATKAAMEDQAAQDKLAHQLERTTGATAAQVKGAEDFISSLSKQTAIADDDLRPALGALATATGDVTDAQDALSLAVDISASTGKDLQTVSEGMAKAYAGNTGALARLVPGLDKATLATKDMDKITAELSRLMGGAATQSAKTAEGQYRNLKIQMGELQETLGMALIPVIEALLPLLLTAADFAQNNTTAIKILVGAVAAVSGAILAANVAMKAWAAAQAIAKAATIAYTAVQWLLNAALSANPIGLVVIALGALTAALVVAYKKSETFRDIVSGAMNGVKSAVKALDSAFDAMKNAALAAWNWITDHWKVALFAFGPIGAAIYVISENFDKVKAAGQAAARVITSAWNKVQAAIQAVIDAVASLIGWIGKIKFPKIPHLPGLKMAPGGIGVTPAGAVATSGAGGVTINIYGAIDPEGTARQIRRLLGAHDRRQGRPAGVLA